MSDLRDSERVQSLVEDLIAQFAAGAPPTASRSLGLVGPGVSVPRPPAHCLRACLRGDANRIQTDGCAWLRSAAAGQLDPTHLQDGKCPRGFYANAQPVRRNGNTGSLLAIEDRPIPSPTGQDVAAPASHSERSEISNLRLLQELESLSRVLEHVGHLLDETEGLADEVLRSYEQLNLIFDFTRQIAGFTDTEAIESALLSRLGELLAARAALLVGPDGSRRCYDVASGKWGPVGDASEISNLKFILNAGLLAEIEVRRESRTVAVCSSPAGHVLLGPLVHLDDKVDVVLVLRPPKAKDFIAGDMLMIESVLAFGSQIISNSELHEHLRRVSLESTRALVAAIDKKDHYTSGHSERVGFLARLTGQWLSLSAADLHLLEMAALLHDVGKIGVPEEILCKAGTLTDEEFDLVRKHPVMGYEILKPIGSFEGVLDGVLFHHENTDGSGYPHGLSGEQIPLFARIIHVVDVFDALISHRSYRPAHSFEQSCEIIRAEAGTKFDPQIVGVFLEKLPLYRAERPEQFAARFCTQRSEISNLKSEVSHAET